MNTFTLPVSPSLHALMSYLAAGSDGNPVLYRTDSWQILWEGHTSTSSVGELELQVRGRGAGRG
jgi:hypothetical protein